MQFVLQTPSLQHLAGVKIVTHLWSQRDVYLQIAPPSNPALGYVFEIDEKAKQWKVIEEKVESNVAALPLPEDYKKPLLNFVKPIGNEIRTWIDHHNGVQNNFHNLDILFRNQLCWNMHGTIDHKKTAELMVKDERLDIQKRYALACFNCLEDEARQLFQSLGEEGRREYLRQLHENYGYSVGEGDVIFYFSYTFNDDVEGLTRHFRVPSESIINQRLFQQILSRGTGASCAYFFQKLSPRQKELVLEECGTSWFHRRDYPTCGLLYYLSLMNEEQQKGMYREAKVLKALLEWPMQPLFTETARLGWSYLDKKACTEVLNAIVGKIRSACLLPNYDYSQLFWECWSLTSAEHKRDFLRDDYYLNGLLYTQREEFIALVFNHAPWNRLQQLVRHRYKGINPVLLDESVISDAALMEYKERAALESSNDPGDENKSWRSKYLGRLVDIAMKKRAKKREESKYISFLIEEGAASISSIKP